MSLTTSELWPYLVLILAGFLPNEVWRWFGFLLARRVDEGSEILVWVRAVATSVLAAVIAKLIFFAPGALASVPLSVRIVAIILGFAGFIVFRRSVFAGVATGEAFLVIGALIVPN